MESRRSALKIIGAIGATCAFPFGADELYGQQAGHIHHFAAAQAAGGPYQPRFFSPSEMNTLSKLCDTIIPPTQTPGAAAAGVPQYIDLVVSASQEHGERYHEGLIWLDTHSRGLYGKPFGELTEEQQIEVLSPLNEASENRLWEQPGVRFFHDLKNMTADGYYTSRIGLVEELGYQGNTVLDHFPVSTVPEH
jgi:gluconate 2-dehydrogenase gamma chain